MRLYAPLAVLTAAALLAACGKSASTDQASTPPTPPAADTAPPAPAAPTSAQAKAVLATLPAAYRGADLDNGQAKFALCKSCHSAGQGGGNMVGPNLFGVFGRKAGSVADFSYSAELKASGIVWDADKIDQWIKGPSAMIPGTKMTYLGMSDAKDRIDVVAYLKVATSAN